MPDSFVTHGDSPEMRVDWHCVTCGREARDPLFDIGGGPWCSDLCRDGVVRVPVKPCCGLLDGDECDCAEFAASAKSAPVIVIGGAP